MVRFGKYLALTSAVLVVSASAAYAGGGGGYTVGGVAQQTPITVGGTAQQPQNPIKPAGTEQQNPIKSGGVAWMPGAGPGGNPSSSAGGSPGGQGATLRSGFRLACIVGGTPAAFPNDIWLTNRGKEGLARGTKVKFEVPSTGYRSAFMLHKALPAGAKVKVVDIIVGGAQPGAACNARLL